MRRCANSAASSHSEPSCSHAPLATPTLNALQPTAPSQTFAFVSATSIFEEVYFHFVPYQQALPPDSTSTIPNSKTTPPPPSKSRPPPSVPLREEARSHRSLPPSTPPVAADRDILLNSIRSTLLTLEVIRPWEKNPDSYSSGITNSIFVLMEPCPSPPLNTRLKCRRRPREAHPASSPRKPARKNLKDPPKHLH